MHVCAMCVYAQSSRYVWLCTCHGQRTPRVAAFAFTSFETGFPFCFSITNAGLASLQASRILLPLFHISPAPRSVRITGVHIYTASFSLTWVLGIRNQILTLPQQAFYPLSHFPSPSLNCVISFINISVSICLGYFSNAALRTHDQGKL